MWSRDVMAKAALVLGGGMLLCAYLFRCSRQQEGLLVLLLCLIGAGTLFYLPVQKQKETELERKEALSRDYSEMLTMLGLYMTAGLSLRSSWEKLVRNYESQLRKGKEKRAVYEEMLYTWKEIKGGEFEDRAYASFGRRCGTQEYLRLGGLLETFVHQGNRELLEQLEQEAAASLTLSLQNIRKKGEQTGTKLLLPLLILFGLSLLMVIVPALMSMQISIT